MAAGGARPGAGRKKKETTELQQSRRAVVLSVLTAPRLKTIVEQDVAAAELGATDRIDRWLPYVLGSPRQEIGGSLDLTLNVAAARQVLRVDGGTSE